MERSSVQPGVRHYEPKRFVALAFVLGMLAVLVLLTLEEVRSADPTQRDAVALAAKLAWALGVAAGVGLNLYHWRRGTLIIRDPDQIAANNQRLRRWRSADYLLPTVGIVLVLGAVLSSFKVVIAGFSGGLIVVTWLLSAWIAAFGYDAEGRPLAPGGRRRAPRRR